MVLNVSGIQEAPGGRHLGGAREASGEVPGRCPGRHLGGTPGDVRGGAREGPGGGTLGNPLGNGPKPKILENKVTKTEGKSRLGVHQRSRKVAFYSVFFINFAILAIFAKTRFSKPP